MTKDELKKLKETIAYFGHWYDVIGEERVLILEKENAELRYQLNKNPCVVIPEWHCKDCLDWLIKAKNTIKAFLLIAKVEHLKDRYETVDEAEQFLKEIEYEKENSK